MSHPFLLTCPKLILDGRYGYIDIDSQPVVVAACFGSHYSMERMDLYGTLPPFVFIRRVNYYLQVHLPAVSPPNNYSQLLFIFFIRFIPRTSTSSCSTSKISYWWHMTHALELRSVECIFTRSSGSGLIVIVLMKGLLLITRIVSEHMTHS